MDLGLRTILTDTDFATAKEKVTAALADQGFGVLSEIDVQATLKNKLDENMEEYTILGACNPKLAHQAIGIHPPIGMLLPCNVVVRADTGDASGRSMIVEAMNPDLMVSVTGEGGLDPVAAQASELLNKAIDALSDD